MKKADREILNRKIINSTAAGLSVLFLMILNSVLNGPAPVILISSGVLFYFCFLKLNSSDMRIPADFIQSGEAAPAIIAGIISMNIQASPVFTGIIMFPVFIASTFFQKLILKREDKEIFLNGFFLNTTLLLLVVFLLFKDSSFKPEIIIDIGTGIWNYSTSIPIITITLIFSVISVYLIIKIYPELALFSHGKSFFRKTGFDYSKTSFFLTILRALMLGMTIIFAGFFAGAGKYFQKSENDYFSNIIFFLKLLTYSQVLLLTTFFINPFITLILSVCLSYIFYFFYIKGDQNAICK